MNTSRTAVLSMLLVSAAALAACSPSAAESAAQPSASSTATETAPRVSTLTLSSPDIDVDGYVTEEFVTTYPGMCTGKTNRSPELAWTGVPEEAVELAVVMTDPAHPNYVHWVLFDLDPTLSGIPAADDGAIGIGTTGRDWRGPGKYAGVCAPDNPYLYTLYALDVDIVGDNDTDIWELFDGMRGHIVDQVELEARTH